MLITRGPPHGVLDLVPRDRAGAYENTGREELLLAVRMVRARLHVFGHRHEGYGLARRDGVTFVNACVCDAAYRPVNEPVAMADLI